MAHQAFEEDLVGPTLHPTLAVQVAMVAGAGSRNATDYRWNVYGTDLGHLFEHQGDLYMVFGDTFGEAGSTWRSNTMARIANPDPASGLVFAEMMTDESGQARELLGSRKVNGSEITVIPTCGTSAGGRMVLHYMSVRSWGAPGRWEVNHSGLAYSDDQGRSWHSNADARWPGTSNFAQVAITEHGGQHYLFGLAAGRFGGVHLARVSLTAILDIGAYRYWDGVGWSRNPSRATTLVPAPVGELSVQWSPFARRWLMLYLDESLRAIVLRGSPQLTGPWSAPEVVATAEVYPTLYAPYIVPGTLDGPDLYFTMSRYDPYAVFLMRTTLTPA